MHAGSLPPLMTDELTLRHAEPGLGALVLAIVGRFHAWRERRRVLNELEALSPRVLADLRISPSDFSAIADGTFRR